MSDCPIKIRITTKRDQGQQVETGRANDLDDVEYDGGDDHAVEFEAAVGEDVEQTAAATVLRQNTHRARVDARTDERVQIVVTHLANLQAAFHDTDTDILARILDQDVGVGVVECGLYTTTTTHCTPRNYHRTTFMRFPRRSCHLKRTA